MSDTEVKRSRKQAITEEAKASNIANLEALAMEFKKGIMNEKKRIALRVKLVGLYKEGISTEDEQSLMELVLNFERGRGVITRRDEYMLNEIEADRLTDTCIVKSDSAPVVHHLVKDMECRFYYDPLFNDNKNRPDSIGRYFVYIPRVIPVDHQISYAVARKELKGHPVDPSEYPEPKTVIHRVAYKKREFDVLFEVHDDAILTTAPKQKEQEYTF